MHHPPLFTLPLPCLVWEGARCEGKLFAVKSVFGEALKPVNRTQRSCLGFHGMACRCFLQVHFRLGLSHVHKLLIWNERWRHLGHCWIAAIWGGLSSNPFCLDFDWMPKKKVGAFLWVFFVTDCFQAGWSSFPVLKKKERKKNSWLWIHFLVL